MLTRAIFLAELGRMVNGDATIFEKGLEAKQAEEIKGDILLRVRCGG